jgi:hypothetical protein
MKKRNSQEERKKKPGKYTQKNKRQTRRLKQISSPKFPDKFSYFEDL